MPLIISDEILTKAQLSEQKLLIDLATYTIKKG